MIYIKEIKSLIILKTKRETKNITLGTVTGEFYQTFREEIILILYNLFQNVEAEAILANSFYKAGIILKPKPIQRHCKENKDQYLS